MRNNQPVTQREYAIPADAAIVSRTDADGRITFVNDDFIAHAGFTREEVIGQPHNIVRHPDMPAEAFRDLWATLQAGRPWTGLVKNRRKDGDHYWVKATATPTPDGGFMSVRVCPTRAEIDAAEALYRRMRSDPNIRLDGGRVAPRGLARALTCLRDLGLGHKLWLSTGASMIAILLASALGLAALDAAGAHVPAQTAADLAPYRDGLWALALLTLLVWPPAAWYVIHTFQRPLAAAVASARDIAAFDLSRPVPSGGRDEIGQLLD